MGTSVARRVTESLNAQPGVSGLTLYQQPISLASGATKRVRVYVEIDNTGKADIPKLGIMFDDGDRFLDHYTVLTSGTCTVDKSLPGLACGSLAAGKELKFTMTAQPRDAGNFTFKFHIANGGLYLNEADGKGYTYRWTQTILSS